LQVQLVKAALPAGELEFDGQFVHDASVDPPVSTPYVPGPQSVQVEFDVAPTALEYFPVPQSVQTSDPVNSLYLPAAHTAHMLPSGPE
jgi:hypothetical protein